MPAIWTRDQGAYFLYSNGESIPIVLTVIALLLLGLGAFVLVLWIIMPFSVFGLKGLMRQCISEQKKTNHLLEKMIKANKSRPIKETDLPEIYPIKDDKRDF